MPETTQSEPPVGTLPNLGDPADESLAPLNDNATPAAVADEQAAPAETQLTPEDIIDANNWEDMAWIASALSIPIDTLTAAHRAGELQSTGAGAVYGGDVLRWIRTQNIPWTVSDEAAEVHRRLQLRKNPPAPKPQPKNYGQQAAEQAAAMNRNEQEDEEVCRAAGNAHLLRFMFREVAAGDDEVAELAKKKLGPYPTEPAEMELRDLACFMSDFGIDADGYDARLLVVRKALERELWHDDFEAAGKATVEARDAYKAMEKRHKEEEQKFWRAKVTAESRQTSCHGAAHDLRMSKRGTPSLFDESDPPRLIQLSGEPTSGQSAG